MANAVRAMKGPTKIIELNGEPSGWKLDANAVHLWKDKLWRKEKVGCVLCTEFEGPEYATLCRSEDEKPDIFHCVQHGALVEVSFTMKKVYTIVIGDVFREGVEELSDTMLFPADMSTEARNELIGRLLDEAEKEEHAAGPSPSDDE